MTEAPAQVDLLAPLAPLGETLPSNGSEVRRDGAARGIAPAVVVAIVIVALLAGFLLGWTANAANAASALRAH